MMQQPKKVLHSLLQNAISQKNYYMCQKHYIMCIKLHVAYQKNITIKKIQHEN